MPAWLKRIPLEVLIVALIAIPYLISTLLHWQDAPLPPGKLIGAADPDPWLRLALLRDWLISGDWYNHEVVRSNSPWGGISTPWTRPLDLVIAFFVKLQPVDVDLNIRILRAAMMIPWLFMTLLMIAMVRAVRTLTAIPSALFLGVALIGAAPRMWNYFEVANADHHSMLTALFVFVMGGVLSTQPTTKLMAITGLLLGLMLWVSPEALVLIGMIYLWYGITWLRGDTNAAHHLATLATAAALMTTLAVAIERPIEAWSIPIYDSVSVVYVFILAASALIAWLLVLSAPKKLAHKFTVSGVASALLAAALWHCYPLAFKGPLAGSHPYIFEHFLPSITEAQNLFQKDAMFIFALLLHPAIALFICITSIIRRECLYDRATAIKLVYFFGCTLVLFMGQVRWFYYSYPLVALVIAPWLGALFSPDHAQASGRWPAKLVEHLPEEKQALRRFPILAVIFLAPLLLAGFQPDKSTDETRKFDACSTRVRQMIYSGQLDEAAGGKSLILFTHTNFGGEVLFWSKQRIIASNYHREGAGIQYIWEADKISDLPSLKQYLAQRKVEALLLCPNADVPKTSVLIALQSEKSVPAWLKRVPFKPYPKEEKKFWDMSEDEPTPADADPTFFLVR